MSDKTDFKYTLEIMREELNNNYICPEVKYAFNASIEALEKQIPKKVTYEGFCPNCRTQYPMYPPFSNKYCSNCGQKLDWD